MSAKKIRIIAIPPGEAPDHIRQAWIGVVIPLLPPPFDRLRCISTAGVLSGPKTPLGQISALLRGKSTKRYGYAVEALTAVGALAEKNPEAAKWWRQNTSYLMEKGGMLVFPADVCEDVEQT